MTTFPFQCWSRNKIALLLQRTFFEAFSWLKTFVFILQSNWRVFYWVTLMTCRQIGDKTFSMLMTHICNDAYIEVSRSQWVESNTIVELAFYWKKNGNFHRELCGFILRIYMKIITINRDIMTTWKISKDKSLIYGHFCWYCMTANNWTVDKSAPGQKKPCWHGHKCRVGIAERPVEHNVINEFVFVQS